MLASDQEKTAAVMHRRKHIAIVLCVFLICYSKVGDKNVQIRNLDTDEVFTYYQADVGALPDAIIDIWGEDNIRELAGTPDGAPTDNANNVRYYHERFSDQTAPAR